MPPGGGHGGHDGHDGDSGSSIFHLRTITCGLICSNSTLGLVENVQIVAGDDDDKKDCKDQTLETPVRLFINAAFSRIWPASSTLPLMKITLIVITNVIIINKVNIMIISMST